MNRMSSPVSVNALAAPLVAALIADAERLRLGIERTESGVTLVDCGIDRRGGIEAGLRVAEICMGGLGRVALVPSPLFRRWPWQLSVAASQPVLACLGSQLAGWGLADGEGKQAYHALGSGPGRALACREPLFEQLGYRDSAEATVIVLEVDKRPPPGILDKILRDCRVAPAGLTVILTPTRSLAGTVQIVARVLEVALHKLHQLGFPLDQVIDGLASAPLPPPARSFVAAMGRTNDAIIYGGSVQLFVGGPDDAARRLADTLPGRGARDHGRPFAEIFAAYEGRFYDIDPLLFSPAQVVVTALDSGNSFAAGALDAALIDSSFGLADGD